MSSLLRLGACALLLCASGLTQAQTYVHQVFLDRDQNAATGCSVASPAGTISGAEARLTATVGSYPAAVSSLTLAQCAGGSFGAESSLSAGYPIGYDLGPDATDVIEFAVDLAQLTGANSDNWTLWFLSTSTATSGADLVGPVTANGLGVPLVPPPIPQPELIPALSPWALLLLSLTLGVAMVWAARRYRGLLPVLVVGAALSITGIAWAANYLLDGMTGDWDVPPLGTDPAGDHSTGEPPGDLRGVYAARQQGRIFFRADVAEAQVEKLIAGLLDTSHQVDENAANGTTVGELRAVTTGLGSLLQFQLQSQAPGAAFAIDADGTVTVADGSLLDAESTPSFTLSVQASINGVAALTITVPVTVAVGDVNEAPLVPDQAFAVDENSAAGTVVGTVTGSDPDAGDVLAWSITGGNTDGSFAIDASTGTITVANQAGVTLANGPFTLVVQASDGALSDSAEVTVTIRDLNDAPDFGAGAPVMATAEDSAVGTVIGSVTATDADAGDTLAYAITGGNTGGAFAIDAATGAISVAAALDHETLASYALTVTATDDRTPPLSDSTTVNVSINDVNEAPLVADQGFNVAENATSGTLVGTVVATDPDQAAPNDTLSYAITAGNAAGGFAINAVTGAITVANSAALDVETTSSFALTVNVTDAGTPAQGASAVVTISLDDANDNAPVADDQAFSVDENAAAGTAVGTLLASDGDSTAPNSTLSYAISGGNAGNAFAIDATTGAISVATPAALDRESDASITLTVTVTDGGTPAQSDTATVTVALNDLNDHAPVGEDAALAVAENAANGTAVGTYAATDADATAPANTLSYAITGGSGQTAFAIDAASGAITVADSAQLDAETTASLTLQVSASDGGTPPLGDTALVTVTISDGNEAPQIAAQSFAIDENSAAATSVGTVVASDADSSAPNSVITYAITAGNPGNAFAIDANSGALSVATAAALDREAADAIELTVTVTDGGSPALSASAVMTVALNDVNDHAPAPVAASLSVDENAANGTAVGTAAGSDADATSPNNTISWSITGGNTNGAFAIDASSGAISVANSAALDSETTASIALDVTATDGGSTPLNGSATISITLNDLNDVDPVVSAATFAVLENSAAGTVVGTVTASDGDGTAPNNTLSYAITAGDAGGAFAIDASGQITVANPALIDAEDVAQFALTVTATDGGTPPRSGSATITVDVTDANEAPVASDASATIDENSANGTTVATVAAVDDDASAPNNQLSYAITAGNTGGAFAIDSAGAITVASSAAVDAETTPVFNLVVTVTDGGTPALSDTAAVTVSLNDLNDNAPQVTGGSFPLDEHSAAGTAVTTVVATDADGSAPNNTLSYAITAGNDGTFAIDAGSGAITVANAASLDREAVSSFDLTVTVTDGGSTPQSGSATVTVSLADINDHAPVASDPTGVSIDENSASGTAVATVPASDGDATAPNNALSYAITAGNGSGAFAIGAGGAITVADASQLNYEAATSFSLTVTVSDGGTPAQTDTATVAIAVNDVNEAPTAGADSYQYVGNTELRVAGHAGSANALAATTATTNVLANDTDPDGAASGFANLAVVPAGPVASTNGVYEIEADGTLTFTPEAGFTGTETITYQLTDGANIVNGSIDFSMTGTDLVWYVRNNDPTSDAFAENNGTSSDPFNLLSQAQTASGADHIVYVHAGDGTTNGQNAGIVLKNGQKLWGQAVALTVNGGTTLITAGSRPQIGNAAGAGVTATNLANVQVRGLNIGGSTDAIAASNNTANPAGIEIADNIIRAAGNEGIDVDNTSTGAFTLSLHDNQLTSTGNAIDVSRTGAGALTITAFDDNIVSGDTGGSGIVVNGAVFDATPGGTFDVVYAGTTSVGVSGNPVGAAGIALTNASGDISLPGIGVYAGSGAALSASGTTTYTGSAGLRITSASGTEVFSSSGGPALDISTATINLAPALARSAASPTYGVNLSAVAGTLVAGSASQIGGTGPAATAYRVAGGSVSTTWNGTITTTQGAGVAISGNSGGHVFGGALSLSTGAAHAVHLDSNAGAAFSFTGGMALTTTSGSGLHAVGSGTLAVTGTSNTVASGTGTAINVRNTTIHGSGITFRSVAASGGANGIVLVSTGALGGLTVTGDGSNTAQGGNGSGGTLSNMAGADGAIAGSAVYMDDTRNVVLRRMTINGTNQNFGIRGFRVHNFTLEYATVTGTHGTSASFDNYGEGAIYFGDDASTATNGLTGTGTFTGLVVNGGRSRNLSIVNTAGTLNRTTVTASSFGLNQSFSDAGTSLAFEARNGGTVLNATVTNSTFTGAPGDLTNFTGQTGTSMDVVYTGNALSNAHAHNVIGGGGLTVASQGVMTFLVQDNDMRDAHGSAITLFKANLGTSMRGTVNNNRIGVAGVPGSGSGSGTGTGNGIFLSLSGAGEAVYAITNNVIRNYDGNAAIYADNTDGSYNLDLTLTGNTATEPGASAFTGVAVTAGAPSSADDIDVCAHVSNNDFSASGGANPDIYLGISTAASSMRLPGYGGSTLAAVESFIQMASVNPAGTLVVAYTDAPAVESQFIGGAACLTP